jgi:hypothetical protein
MHGQKIDAQFGGRGDGAFDGIAYVEKLEIEKNALAFEFQFASKRETLSKQQLQSDLVEAHIVAETIHQSPRVVVGWQVECDNELIFGGVLHVDHWRLSAQPCSTRAARASFWITIFNCSC